MTISLKSLAACVSGSNPVSARNLVAIATAQIPFRVRLQPLPPPASLLRVMRHLEWQWCGDANYLKMPVPTEYRSPSREEAQIRIEGVAHRVALFMGKSDWELDWHIFLDLEPAVTERLGQVGRLRDSLFCEWMVVNRWEDELVGRQWWSSDMDTVLSLRWPLPGARDEAQTASEHWSLVEDDNQGGSSETVADASDPQSRGNARIVGARVILQGAFVMDAPTDTDEHGHLEIHPLDSLAYAQDGRGSALAAAPDQAAWPDRHVVWRVAAVSNAGFHRINDCSFVSKARTSVWYLDPPRLAGAPMSTVSVTYEEPGFWRSPTSTRIARRRVHEIRVDPPADGQQRSLAEFPVDPADGRHKLRVQVTMEAPDDWGGLFLRDYSITVRFSEIADAAVLSDHVPRRVTADA